MANVDNNRNINVNDLVNVAKSINEGLQNAAASPTNDLKPGDVRDVKAEVQQTVEKAIEQKVQPVIDHLANQEPFWQSRQWWMAMLGIVTTLLGAFGYVLPEDFKEQAFALITAIIGVITTATLLYNRYWATKPIGK